MNQTVPARIQARSRADHRLQSMTLGAAALGIVATGAFGYAAALTYNGKTTTADAAQPVDLGGQLANPNVQNTVPNTGGSSGSSGTQGGTVNPNTGTNPQTNTQNGVTPPTITRQRHHATTGGS